MFGLFGKRGWEKLPEDFLAYLKERLGDDFAKLDDLAQREGLFRQEFFRKPISESIELQSAAFSGLITSLANQLGSNNRLDDAEDAYHIALKLEPDSVPAAAGLTNVYSVKDDLDSAVRVASQGLQSLWDQPAGMREMDHNRGFHMMLARVIAEKAYVDRATVRGLQLARELAADRDLPRAQKERLVRAYLEIGGPEHDLAIEESCRVMTEVFVDVTSELGASLQQQLQNNASQYGYFAGMVDLATVGDPANLAVVCTRLDPDNIDAWILAAQLKGLSAAMGSGYNSQAFEYALEALDRIGRYLEGDTQLFTKDAALTHRSGDPTKVTNLLKRTLEDNLQFVSDDQQARAAIYISNSSSGS